VKYKKGTRRRALEYEKDLVNLWKENKTFEKSVEQRPKENSYVFYDGPPFITGVPHHGTLLSSIVKDAIPRYQAMKGKRVERVWGWDCHGLPAEVFTEKKLGITQKEQVYEIGLEKYITTCRDNMVQTGDLWEDTIDRIGRWVDFKGAYKTMDKEYMESVWWAFKTLYEKGKIYEGERVLMYCTRDATPLSKAEVTMDGGAYQDVTDPSVFIKFKLADSDASLLAWTTTPWTLPANTALAINKNHEFVEVELDGERLILAKELVEKALTNEKHQLLDYKIIKTIRGKELVGKSYEPLFGHVEKNANKVWHGDFVSLEEGTGIVHIAPAYGEDDFVLAQQKNIPVLHVVDDNGVYNDGQWKGQLVWDINKQIAKDLLEKGVALKIDYIRHSYPHCHRCGTKLMYRAHPSWFMDIENQRQDMLEQNGENIYWFPEHVKNGRFAKTIESAPDWNLSRDRFWATPMPIWKGVDANGNEKIKVIGSYQELKELSGIELEDYHRPWVDDVTFTIDGTEYKRTEKVMDCWFESGSMPFAQFHYPFENVKKFEDSFPGDFIAEYIGQVRAWFYYLHAISVGLFGKNAYKNVIVTGTLLGADGRKLSKSLNNFTDPNILMDQYSADSLRFLLLSSPALAGEDFIVNDKDVGDIARKLTMIWNMYDFFTLYAEVDKWEWDGDLSDPSPDLNNVLDVWIVSRLHQLQSEMETNMEKYDIPNALKPVLPFIDDASNWFVRRSRKRFWKSGNDSDKNDAYRTLHFVLVRLSQILAPFTPFLAEELYRKMTGGESVHLLDWPTNGHINELSLKNMALVRQLITEGLSQRAAAGVKVRQPLGLAEVTLEEEIAANEWSEYQTILLEELNVKAVTVKKDKLSSIMIDTVLTTELKSEGLSRDVIRQVQAARKKANLEVDDRILLDLNTKDKDLALAIKSFSTEISSETLATMKPSLKPSFEVVVTVNEASLTISLAKD
jgi:isoleucyl-tRNA synthetase